MKKVILFFIDIIIAALLLLAIWFFNYKLPGAGIHASQTSGQSPGGLVYSLEKHLLHRMLQIRNRTGTSSLPTSSPTPSFQPTHPTPAPTYPSTSPVIPMILVHWIRRIMESTSIMERKLLTLWQTFI